MLVKTSNLEPDPKPQPEPCDSCQSHLARARVIAKARVKAMFHLSTHWFVVIQNHPFSRRHQSLLLLLDINLWWSLNHHFPQETVEPQSQVPKGTVETKSKQLIDEASHKIILETSKNESSPLMSMKGTRLDNIK